MRKIILPCGFILLSLLACNYSNTNNTNTPKNSNTTSNTNNANKPDSTTTKADFSTPKTAVETFINAASNRDANLLSRCFDAESAGEFRKFREKTASQKDLDELAEFAQGAKVTDVEESGDAAEVNVKFKARDEQITMRRGADGWKIVDF